MWKISSHCLKCTKEYKCQKTSFCKANTGNPPMSPFKQNFCYQETIIIVKFFNVKIKNCGIIQIHNTLFLRYFQIKSILRALYSTGFVVLRLPKVLTVLKVRSKQKWCVLSEDSLYPKLLSGIKNKK